MNDGALERALTRMGEVSIFGICPSCQIPGFSVGGRTFRLKFGYRGANNPVNGLPSGKVSITSEKRGFGVGPKSLKSGDVEMTQINLNDQSVEAVRHKKHPVFSVQYHAEASPWRHDADCLFDGFRELILDSA